MREVRRDGRHLSHITLTQKTKTVVGQPAVARVRAVVGQAIVVRMREGAGKWWQMK